ncbi:MAG: type VI secretion system membrane subunit TssM [Paracoccaceae bacterium]
MLRPVFRALSSGYAIIIYIAAILSLCFWFFGPFIATETWHPFDSPIVRFVVIDIIFLIALAIILITFLRARAREKKLEEGIIDAPATKAEAAVEGPDDSVVSEELGDLKGKLRTAMNRLRKSKLGSRHLYELPWYVMIGPPGAGKTTAIVNSGLKFPLADEMGKSAIGGVGGTRNCDWWFTDDAVLIDTAGRYTTQESDAEADNAAWLGFLNLLKKYRKRQPINGAIVAISLADLSLQDETTRQAHATAVRRRLNELREKLGVRFPVYVLFTKADLIAGFTEFFDALGKEEREQVWGFTLDLAKGKAESSPVAAFNTEFAALLERLNAQSLERMQAETDHQRRSLVAGFPSQVASVRQVADDFLAEVFQDSRFEKRHMLRGVYFTSGTQEGTPIDRLMMGMAKTFGIGRQAIGTGRGTGRSFFLTRLFTQVIFREAGLVSADDKVERRYRWTRRAAIAATVLLVLGVGTLWTRSYLGNRELTRQARASVAEYRTAAAAIPGSPIGDTDLPAVVPALNVLRDMPGNPTVNDPDPPTRVTFGLYQGDVIGTQAAQTYRAALNQHFLPRLLLRLEEQMQANMNNKDLLYEALKVYLMLGQQGPMNTDLVKEWMNIDWSLAYPGAAREELRSDLADHLGALLDQPMEKIALNGPLVERVQKILSEMPLAQRVYNGIINSQTAQDLPKWRLTDVGGPAISRVMVRSSGKPLSDGVEGIFTYAGFRNVFLSEALGVAKRVQRESWVLGPAGEAEQSKQALVALSRDVLDLYYNDYIERYDSILADLDIIPMESLSHAVEVTNVLSGPTSPIVNVLTAVAKETQLTKDPSMIDKDKVGDTASTLANLELRAELSTEGQVLLDALSSTANTGGGDSKPKPPGSYVEERFAWLQDLVARPEGQPSQLDQMMQTLTEVYQELNKLSFSGGADSGLSGSGGQAIQRFQEAAARIPGPMQRWAAQIASGSSGITADGTRSSINARWQAQVLPFCEKALDNRYPFDRRARADVAMQDFQKLFGPGGLIDSFVDENLLKFIDTRSRPWSWKRVNDVDLGISASVLQQMQYAAEIRDAFFAGSEQPSVKFQITPEALDPKARSVTLNIDGQEVSFRHRDGQPTPKAVTWPGNVGLARLTLEPDARNTESSVSRDGPWAWFRLLDGAEVRRTNVSDRKRVIFNVGGRIAIFQLQSGSVLNPFALPALSKFSCPKSF